MHLKTGWLKNSYFRGNIGVLAVSGAFTNMGTGVMALFMPEYFQRLGGNTLILGLMGFAVLIIRLAMYLIGGFTADQHGRKKIIVTAAFYAILTPILYAVFQDWRLFVAVTIIAAISNIAVPAKQVIIADSAPPEKRARGISASQVISSLPLAVTPLVWGWLIDTMGWVEGFQIGCIYSIATALTAALILQFFLKETINPQTQTTQKFSIRASLSEAKQHLTPSLTALMASYCLIAFANATVANYYIIYATEQIGLPTLEWSLILSLQMVSALALKIPGAWIADKTGKKKILTISALTCAPLTIAFTLSGNFTQVLIVMLLLVVAGIYYDPVYQALQADLTPRHVRGRIIMLWSITSATASALGSFTGGLTYQTLNTTTPFYIFTITELAAVTLIIAAVKEPTKKEP